MLTSQGNFRGSEPVDVSALSTNIYRVGVNDVLFIDLKSLPNSSGYYTVRPDGTIDYPLAGNYTVVVGLKPDEIESTLVSRIIAVPEPKIEVRVRHYGSHHVSVSGAVQNPGTRNLQREAVPLFVLRAEAGVDARAVTVSIYRGPGLPVELYDLLDPSTDNVLVYPGNKVDFSISPKNAAGSYFIAGEINLGGQKPFSEGLTLYQAIVALGGQKRSPVKAIIRRRGKSGTLVSLTHDLKAIRSGKALDPRLAPGDMIEIRK